MIPQNVSEGDQRKMDEDYDVVIDVLSKHKDVLVKMSSGERDWGIMDYIRMEQIDQIKKAIKLWEDYKKDNNNGK